MMCFECCKEFGGWCKSFTKSEFFLCILQAVLLIVFFTCLTFLILHLHVCFKFKKKDVLNDTATLAPQYKDDTSQSTHGDNSTQIAQYEKDSGQDQNKSSQSTHYTQTTNAEKELQTTKHCSWTPSHKTEAVTHYYDTQSQNFIKSTIGLSTDESSKATENLTEVWDDNEFNDDILSVEEFDSVEADHVTKGYILALVKITHPKDIMFGCTLTIISEYWTLTAASCIEAVEEVDALDSFVMLEGLGEDWQGRIHVVSDVLIHPQYHGTNYSFDLTALRSDDSLIQKGQDILRVATMVDHLLIPIGERLTILGYGKYRSFSQETRFRRAHVKSVYALPWQQCATGAGGREAWAPRHLAGGRAVATGGCGAGVAGCAGGLRARAAACGYCGGAPVTRARTLLGVAAAGGGACGAGGGGCAPAAYAPLAPLARWLRSVTHAQ